MYIFPFISYITSAHSINTAVIMHNYVIMYMHMKYHTYISNTFTDLPTVTNIRNTSRICVTYFNISWDAPSITCGDVYYEVSISQPPIEGDAVVTTVDSFLSVTGLNNSLPDVTITVTAINRAGQGDGRMFPVQLPKSLGKCCP